jgi:mono/diheme cytochrome c family protein
MGEMKMKWLALFFALVAAAAGFWYLMQPTAVVTAANNSDVIELPDDAIVIVNLPVAFSDQEQIGQRAYKAACSACHGLNAQGRESIAPPLVHRIYEPSHHGDMAFVLAAQNGVRAHHWKFGNMPAVEGVTRADVLNIVTYVRALQRENGIN